MKIQKNEKNASFNPLFALFFFFLEKRDTDKTIMRKKYQD